MDSEEEEVGRTLVETMFGDVPSPDDYGADGVALGPSTVVRRRITPVPAVAAQRPAYMEKQRQIRAGWLRVRAAVRRVVDAVMACARYVCVSPFTWYERAQFTAYATYERHEPRVHAFATRWCRVRAWHVIVGALVWCAYVAFGPNPPPPGTAFVRDGEPGANYEAPSLSYECSALRRIESGEDVLGARLRVHAANVAATSPLPCVCAPMLGTRTRMLTLASPGGGGGGGGGDNVLHVYNPRVAGGGTIASTVVLEEDDSLLFPCATHTVERERADELELTFTDPVSCATRRMVVRDALAHCVQYCLDLFDAKLHPPPPLCSSAPAPPAPR